jgi:predicted metal-dependent HD superfamily phosphohydrolase
VRDLILATRHDVSPPGGDAALLVDVDLAILGSPAERFDEYERQVRQEYSWCRGSCSSERDVRFSRGSCVGLPSTTPNTSALGTRRRPGPT